jgi:hypothetical protein
VRLSTQQLAHVATKRARPHDPYRFLPDQLKALKQTIDGVEDVSWQSSSSSSSS